MLETGRHLRPLLLTALPSTCRASGPLMENAREQSRCGPPQTRLRRATRTLQAWPMAARLSSLTAGTSGAYPTAILATAREAVRDRGAMDLHCTMLSATDRYCLCIADGEMASWNLYRCIFACEVVVIGTLVPLDKDRSSFHLLLELLCAESRARPCAPPQCRSVAHRHTCVRAIVDIEK